MKKCLILFFFLCSTVWTMAQAPAAFNYQGIARNVAGLPYANQTLNVRLTIHSGTANGNIEYAEVRTITTNAFGLFNIQVGGPGANNAQGSFTAISWSSEAKFLQTEINLPGTLVYTDLGTVELQSVPYALHSREAADLKWPVDKTLNHQGNMFALTNTSSETSSSAIQLNSTVGYGLDAHSESGTGVRAKSPYGTALEVDGALLIHGGNTSPGADKVLTSDAFGNAAWKENAAAKLKLPFDTTVGLNVTRPLFHIKDNAASYPYPVASFENIFGPGLEAYSDSTFAIRAFSKSKSNATIFGFNDYGAPGVAGSAHNSATGVGVKGIAGSGNNSAGVLGDGEGNSIGVKGISTNYMGVAGISTNQIGVYAASTNGIGLEAISNVNYAVSGYSLGEHGVAGLSGASNKAGVVGSSLSPYGIGVLGEVSQTDAVGVKAKGNSNNTALEVDGSINIHGAGQVPGAGKVLTSDANGNATWQKPFALKQIGFSVRNANPTSVPPNTWVKVPFSTEEFDGSNSYISPAQSPASTFKVPVPGLYHIDAQVSLKDFLGYAVRANIRLVCKRNGVTTSRALRYGFADQASTAAGTAFAQKLSLSLSGNFFFEANDEVWIEFAQNNELLPSAVSLSLAENEECLFSGYLIMEN